MRDPNRIDEMLAALRATWLQSPDLRLGQLIVNAVRPSQPCPEVFYFEDDALLGGLERFRSQVRERKPAGSA